MKGIILFLTVVGLNFVDVHATQQKDFIEKVSYEYKLNNLYDTQTDESNFSNSFIGQDTELTGIRNTTGYRTGEMAFFGVVRQQEENYSDFIIRNLIQKLEHKFIQSVDGLHFYLKNTVKRVFNHLAGMSMITNNLSYSSNFLNNFFRSSHVLEILNRSGMIRATDERGMSVLMYAAICNSCDTANWIISHMNPLQLVSYMSLNDYHRHYTALHWAVYYGNLDMVALLIDTIQYIESFEDVGEISDIFINAGSESNTTPLYLAFYNNYLHIAKMLIYAGADVNMKSGRFEETPMYLPISRLSASAYNTVDFLIRMGAKVEVLDMENKTPLHLAALYGCFDIAKLLIESLKNTEKRKKYIYSQDIYGYTAFHLAVVYNRFSIVNLLLRNLEDPIDKFNYICLPNNDGQTAFYSATVHRNHDATEFIIKSIEELYTKNIDLQSRLGITKPDAIKKATQDPL